MLNVVTEYWVSLSWRVESQICACDREYKVPQIFEPRRNAKK